MKLYDKAGKIVNVYELTPNYNLIRDFKVKEIEKIPFEIRLLYATTNDKDLLKSETLLKVLDNDELNYSVKKFGIIRKFHKLGIYEGLNNKENFGEYIKTINYIQTILNNYYQGTYDRENLALVKGDNGGNLPLLIAGSYIYENQRTKKRTMPNLIHLSDSLYLLHLLLNEQYDLLSDSDIENILKLFNFDENPVKYNIDDMNSDITLMPLSRNENFKEFIIRKSNESQNVLQLVKQQVKGR